MKSRYTEVTEFIPARDNDPTALPVPEGLPLLAASIMKYQHSRPFVIWHGLCEFVVSPRVVMPGFDSSSWQRSRPPHRRGGNETGSSLRRFVPHSPTWLISQTVSRGQHYRQSHFVRLSLPGHSYYVSGALKLQFLLEEMHPRIFIHTMYIDPNSKKDQRATL